MKLLLCRQCSDVVKLGHDIRSCRCKASHGRYQPDGIHAEVWGDSVDVIGILNESVSAGVTALNLGQPDAARGPDVQAFLFPRVHERIKRMGLWRDPAKPRAWAKW